MGNELALIQNVDEMLPTTEVLQKMKVICDYYVTAGLLPPGYKNGSDLMVVGIRARELGVSLGQAVQGMFPMQGRIGYMGGFLSAMVSTKLPNSDIRIKESTKEKCVLEWRKKPEDAYQEEEFTFEEVEACNYHQNPVKDSATGHQKVDASGHLVWKPKGPWGDRKNMLYWRCLTRVINRHFSTVFGSAVYTADEIQDMDVIDVPVVAKAASNVPYVTKANTTVPVEEVVATVTEIEDAVIVEPAPVIPKQEDIQPETPAGPTQPVEEQLAEKKMTQSMVDALVAQFEKDVFAAKTKREIEDRFENFKKTGVPAKVLTNCFKIQSARKKELAK